MNEWSDDSSAYSGYLPLRGDKRRAQRDLAPHPEPPSETLAPSSMPARPLTGMNAFFYRVARQPDATPSDTYAIAQDCGARYCIEHDVVTELGRRCPCCPLPVPRRRPALLFAQQQRRDLFVKRAGILLCVVIAATAFFLLHVAWLMAGGGR